MSPFGEESADWESGICIGGILVVSGEVGEFPRLEINDEVPVVEMNKVPRRLISFFELLGKDVGVRLWTPERLVNNDPL